MKTFINSFITICFFFVTQVACKKESDGLKVSPSNNSESKSGQLLFSRQENSMPHVQIFVLNLENGEETQLTFSRGSSPISNYNPIWSPTHNEFVFSSNKDGSSFEIYTMNLDDSTTTRLTNNTLSDLDPNYSPDGSQIIYIHDENKLSIVNKDGSDLKQISFSKAVINRIYNPQWSPDGSKIMFESFTNNGTVNSLYEIDSDGSNLTLLTNDRSLTMTEASYSPDGSKIVFSSTVATDGIIQITELYMMNRDGSDVVRLTNFGRSSSRYYRTTFAPCWSPNGTHLAFTSSKSGGNFNVDLFTMKSDGSDLQQLTNTSDALEVNPSWK